MAPCNDQVVFALEVHFFRGIPCSSGLITLPSERTLQDYTHWIRSGVGFMQEVDAQLVSEADIQEDKDEAVERLEYCGFNVIAFCCDGASPNRKFYKMHGSATSTLGKLDNRILCNNHACIIERWKIYISWDHLVRLYNQNRTALGLSLIPKVRRDHVYLASYSRMRVNLAAQVNKPCKLYL